MLTTNQRMDKLSAQRVDFTARGMLNNSIFHNCIEVPQNAPSKRTRGRSLELQEDDDGGAVDDGKDITGEVLMARTPGMLREMRQSTILNPALSSVI